MSEALGRLIAAGNVAEVFELGRRVVKLYRRPRSKAAAFREGAIHAAVEDMGLPVPVVWGTCEFAGRWGVVFDRVDGVSFAERIRADPTVMLGCLDVLVRTQALIHANRGDLLPGLRRRLAAKISNATCLEEVRRRALLSGLARMPDGDRLCHGDFHPGNVLGEAARPLVIDWPDASCGDPAADCCRSHLLLQLQADDLAEPYLDACRRAGGPSRDAILAWRPYLAAARIAEDVPGEADRLIALANRP